MFKITFYIHRKKRLQHAAFRNYWLGEHAELVKKLAEDLGIRKIIKCEVLPHHPVELEGHKHFGIKGKSYDFVDHWVFKNIADLKRGRANLKVLNAMKALYDSEDQYISVSKSSVEMQIDIAQNNGPEVFDLVAATDSPVIKIMYTARLKKGISRKEGQLHWQCCHGGLSRENIKHSSYFKYFQSHNIESTFVKRMIQERGYYHDKQLAGHAEAWLDLSAKPKKTKKKLAQKIAIMDKLDIELFVNNKKAQFFVAKEHFILDKKVFDLPMPTFFSAVY